jgi:hypothetical protein
MRSLSPSWLPALVGLVTLAGCTTDRALHERYFTLPNGYVSEEDLAGVPPDVWFVFEESQSRDSYGRVRTYEVTFDGHVTRCEESIAIRHLEGAEPMRERTRSCDGPRMLSALGIARLEEALAEPHVQAGGVYGEPPRWQGTPEHLILHRSEVGAPAVGVVLRSPEGSPSVEAAIAEVEAILGDAPPRP